MTSWFLKTNILIDEAGNTRLADSGLLKIVSDPANLLPSSSHVQAGAIRWMSPELIFPQRFGLEKSRPTKYSDCYALGMVIYETLSGNLPFYEHANVIVLVKLMGDERPTREAMFPEHVWNMLERCWRSKPSDRPSVWGVLQCLQGVPGSLYLPSGMDEEMDRGAEDEMEVDEEVNADEEMEVDDEWTLRPVVLPF